MKKCMLVIAIVLSLVCILCACGQKDFEIEQTVPVSHEITDFGSGKTRFVFETVDIDGNITKFNVHTDKEIVGEALQEYGLIKGEEGDYGIYIKEVNGIVADYDIDGTYWAFYVNDEMSMVGADQTPVVDGDVYSFRVEKG